MRSFLLNLPIPAALAAYTVLALLVLALAGFVGANISGVVCVVTIMVILSATGLFWLMASWVSSKPPVVVLIDYLGHALFNLGGAACVTMLATHIYLHAHADLIWILAGTGVALFALLLSYRQVIAALRWRPLLDRQMLRDLMTRED